MAGIAGCLRDPSQIKDFTVIFLSSKEARATLPSLEREAKAIAPFLEKKEEQVLFLKCGV